MNSVEFYKKEIEEIYINEYSELIEIGIYRNPLNYYLVCSYPIVPSISLSNPEEMFKNFNGKIALYFHLPFCFKRCTFCNFYLHTKGEMKKENVNNLIDEYILALKFESEFIINSLKENNSNFEIHSIYIGGGTPTILDNRQLEFLIEEVIKNNFGNYFPKEGLVEFTVEASPGTITQEKLILLKNLGVTRLSIGVQTFDNHTLKLMNRDHDKDTAKASIKLAKDIFSDNFNIDIIVGFPTEKKNPQSGFERLFLDLNEILQLEIPSVTFYHLWTRGMKKTALIKNVHSGIWYLPSQVEIIKYWLLINKMLNKDFNNSNLYIQNPAGWFIRENSALFKQQIFKWGENNNYLGIGVDTYDYFNGYASQPRNFIGIRGTLDYIEMIKAKNYAHKTIYKLTDDEIDRLRAVFAIKTRDGLNLSLLKDPKRFDKEIKLLNNIGLIEIFNPNVKLTPKGFVFFDEVSEFFFKPEELAKIGKKIDTYTICRNRVNYLIRKNIKNEEKNFRNYKSSQLRERLDEFLKKKIYNSIKEPFDFFMQSSLGEKYKRTLFVYLYYEPNKLPDLLTPYYTNSTPHYREVILDWFIKKINTKEAVSLTSLIFSPPSEDAIFFPPLISLSLEKPLISCSAINIILVNKVQEAIKNVIKIKENISVSEKLKELHNNNELNAEKFDEYLKNLTSCNEHNQVIKVVFNELIQILGSKYPEKANSLQQIGVDPSKLWPSFIAFMGNDDYLTKHYIFIPLDLNERCLPIGVVMELSDMLTDDEFYKVYNFYNSTLPIISKFIEKIKAEIKHRESMEHALKFAVSAILTESYAHNIGAHGLEGLKIYLYNQWSNVKKNILKKKDVDSILKIRTELLNNMKIFDNSIEELIKTHSNVPNYLSYLQGKSAFWSAIARGGVLIGGRITNMWELINEFAKNNLLCGSLGASEGYKGIEFYVEYNNGESVRIGASKIEDDLRYRFEEEGLRDTEGDCLNNYKARTNLTIDNKELDKIEKLKKELEKLQIFLPEGVVGQQAIYTIWENIIRNVKHCKKQNGIDLIPFYITINDNSHDWIEICSWIDLKSIKSITNEEMNKWEGILDENNKPNMGGKSQNILCAGIVFGQDYITTEKLQKQPDISKKPIRINYQNNIVKYSFRIWKGKEILVYENFKNCLITTEYTEPIGRYRIVQLSEDDKIEFFNNPFFLRYVINNDYQNQTFSNLYSEWIKNWLPNYENLIIKVQEKEGYFKGLKRNNSEKSIQYDYYLYHREPNNTVENTVKIAYKESDSIGKIINDINLYIQVLLKNTDKEKERIIELIEILETSFEIFDNRLYIISEKILGDPKITSFKVNIYPEEESQLPKDNQNNENMHFGIFHLSFIERITNERNHLAVRKFFTNNNTLLKRYKIVIITTGRGRNWWDGLDDELKLKIKYIPIENLEKCFEDAKIHAPKAPAIGAKYLLVKTIFGS